VDKDYTAVIPAANDIFSGCHYGKSRRHNSHQQQGEALLPSFRRSSMLRILLASIILALATIASAQDKPAGAPAEKPALFATTKVDGTDNVYVFRYGNHQAMFVVTSAGVIATDPIGYGRPQAVTTYIDEIKKVTNQPIKYLIYSHHHYDHIAGGKPFKDAGAVIIAHKRAKERLEVLKDPFTPLPDEVMTDKRVITLVWYHAGADLSRPQPLRQLDRDAPAQGESAVRRGYAAGRLRAGPRHDRLSSAGS